MFDYIDGGADDEVTLRENCRIFDDVTFRPRNAVATTQCDLRTTVLGATFDLAVSLLAPVGSCAAVLPARRRSGGARGRRARAPATSCPRCRAAGSKTSAPRRCAPAWYQLYRGRRTGGRDDRHRARAARRFQRAGRHHRHTGGWQSRARHAQWHQGARQPAADEDAAVSAADPRAARLASWVC